MCKCKSVVCGLGILMVVGGAVGQAICSDEDYGCEKYATIGKIVWIAGASTMGFACCLDLDCHLKLVDRAYICV